MKIKLNKSPRKFIVGMNKKKKIKLTDCGKIYLKPNEQISFVTQSHSSHDVTRKKWGFYATQSINSRLKKKLYLILKLMFLFLKKIKSLQA